jgi:hypothetical protein
MSHGSHDFALKIIHCSSEIQRSLYSFCISSDDQFLSPQCVAAQDLQTHPGLSLFSSSMRPDIFPPCQSHSELLVIKISQEVALQKDSPGTLFRKPQCCRYYISSSLPQSHKVRHAEASICTLSSFPLLPRPPSSSSLPSLRA